MKKTRKFFTASLILFPILNSAHIGNLNFGFGDAFLVLAYGIALLSHANKIKCGINKDSITFWPFVIYLIVITIINCSTIPSFKFSSIFMPIIRYTFYGIVLYSNRKFFDREFGKKFYINTCVIEALYGLLQFAITIIAGIALPYVLPFTTMEYGSYGADYNATVLWTMQNVDGMRLVGFFPEASHFAQYTIICIVFLLFTDDKSKKNIIKLIIVSLAILLTKSSVGIICYGIILIYYMMTEKHMSAKKLFTRIALLVLATFALLIIGNKMNILDFIRERLSQINERTYAVSGNIRIIRGFLIYGEAPLHIKIFGIGCGNYVNFIDYYHIKTFFDLVMDRNNEYMNAFSLLLIRSGIVGTGIFSVFAGKLFMKINREQKAIFYVWILLLFTENIFFSPIFVLLLWFMMPQHGNHDEPSRKFGKISS